METEITIPNECSLDKVGSDCKPIVNTAIESYRRNLDKLLVSIRLLGSTAAGKTSLECQISTLSAWFG